MKHRDVSAAVEVELRWRPAPLVFMLAAVSAPALALAIILGQWQLVVFAAPMVVAA